MVHQHANTPVRRLPSGISIAPAYKGQLPRYPVDYPSLERAAAEVLPSWVYFYVGYGAGGARHTQQANIEAFELQLCGGAKGLEP